MAQILISEIARNYSVVCDFIRVIKYDDGGESAMNDVFEMSLGDLVVGFLGEGDWIPRAGVLT